MADRYHAILAAPHHKHRLPHPVELKPDLLREVVERAARHRTDCRRAARSGPGEVVLVDAGVEDEAVIVEEELQQLTRGCRARWAVHQLDQLRVYLGTESQAV